MNLRLLPAVLAIFSCALPTWADPWPGVAFTEVRAYAWSQDRHGQVMLTGGVVAPGARPARGKPLTPEQRVRVLKAQERRDTARPRAGCYEPHNSFVFYNAQRKPVAFIEVCFDCLGARVWPTDPECDPDYLILGQICAELKLPYGRFSSLEEFT